MQIKPTATERIFFSWVRFNYEKTRASAIQEVQLARGCPRRRRPLRGLCEIFRLLSNRTAAAGTAARHSFSATNRL